MAGFRQLSPIWTVVNSIKCLLYSADGAMTQIEKKDSNGSKSLRIKHEKDKAIRELELMHKAIEAGDYKKAIHHKIIANVAIDEMVGQSKMVDEE